MRHSYNKPTTINAEGKQAANRSELWSEMRCIRECYLKGEVGLYRPALLMSMRKQKDGNKILNKVSAVE